MKSLDRDSTNANERSVAACNYRQHKFDFIGYLQKNLRISSVKFSISKITDLHQEDKFWYQLMFRVTEVAIFDFDLWDFSVTSINVKIRKDNVILEIFDNHAGYAILLRLSIEPDGALSSGRHIKTPVTTLEELLERARQRTGKGDGLPQRVRSEHELDGDEVFLAFERLSDEEQQRLSERISDHLSKKPAAGLPPHIGATTPPNGLLYGERPNLKETAPAFIERVYGKAGWLTGSFTRADLRKLDRSAVWGLSNWERVNGRSSLNLPTIKERNDKELATIESHQLVKSGARLKSAAWRRSHP